MEVGIGVSVDNGVYVSKRVTGRLGRRRGTSFNSADHHVELEALGVSYKKR